MSALPEGLERLIERDNRNWSSKRVVLVSLFYVFAELRSTDGPGKFNVVTFVEWQDSRSMEAAKKIMAERQARDGFRPNEFLEKLEVSGDIGIYRRA